MTEAGDVRDRDQIAGDGEQRVAHLIVLAGGRGMRLQRLTRRLTGEPTPKQFCRFSSNGKSLLEQTIDRTLDLVPERRVSVVVTGEQVVMASEQLTSYREARLLVQPCDRGTAPGLLLPVLDLQARDPQAIAVVTPADHAFADNLQVCRLLQRACEHCRERPRDIVLLGVEPDAPRSDYGWIVRADGPVSALVEFAPVSRFEEKPPPGRASELMLQGGLFNTLVMVACVSELAALFARVAPELMDALDSYPVLPYMKRRPFLEEAFAELSPVDLSRDVLSLADNLVVASLPSSAGWTDLGDEERLLDWLAANGDRDRIALLSEPPPPVIRDANLGGRAP